MLTFKLLSLDFRVNVSLKIESENSTSNSQLVLLGTWGEFGI